MSGLEKAIRNALAQSERNNADIRARIYHSARQALEAGLRKQDVTNPDVVDAQRQRLEAKIREIEFEERQRLAIERAQTPAIQPVSPAPNSNTSANTVAPPARPPADAPQRTENRDDAPIIGSATAQDAQDDLSLLVGGPRRDNAAAVPSDAGSLGDLGVSRRGGREQPAELRPRRELETEQPRPRRWWQSKKQAAPARVAAQPQTPRAARLDIAAGKEGRPRKRRRWISGLVLPLIVLGGAGWGVWWAAQNGIIVMPDLSSTPVNGSGGNSQAPTGFEPGRGFSEEWAEIFIPKGTEGVVPAGGATVEAVNASGGQAVRITSQSPGPDGEVAIEVPPEILREMAGKTSTVAVTLQTAADRSVEVAVRCDFGSLGGCSRHRFRATQEKTDALFRVNFDRSLAPNRPGRIYLNSDVLGGRLPIYVFSMRILPGQ
ncbi:hypothetical protein [Neorhizobium sp. JUb45]|uniref:hypothetical protein n=1 Tax=unclassified Neorhizobium TaxID=2629175 RepID=UPI0010521F03|nr:hypothetical protein [Neorhizobium sp. JUb45]TCR02109.1 hypothetical protein EDF70_104387 [Neorhizobium sp. JUb45]